MTVFVTGATFQHRDTLKRYGAQWDSEEKRWFFPRGLRPFEIDEIKRLVGCMVVEIETPKPQPSALAAAIQAIAVAHNQQTQTRNDGRYKTVIYGDDERYFNYFKDINPRSFFGFSSLAKMVDYIKAIPEEKRTGRRDNGFTSGNAAFCGSQSMDHALTIMERGWPEGVEQAAEVLDMFDIEHATARRRSYAVAGGAVSVGRLLAGNPLHMVKRPRQPGRRIVTLFLETSVSSDIKPKSMIARGAVIAAISDVLERQGYSCEIVNIDSTRETGNNRPAVQIAVTLKQAGETLNLPDLIFALAHPSYARRFCFACVCSADELRNIWVDQGQASVAFNNQYKPSRNEFYIPNLTNNPDGKTLREKAAIILKSLEPLNLPLQGVDNPVKFV